MSDLVRPSPPPSWRDRLDSAVGMARAAPALAAAAAGALVLAGILAFFVLHRSAPAAEIHLPRAEAATTDPTATTIGEVVVDIAGAVVRPGVVRLGGAARVADAIAAAGGAVPDADVDQVNLAAKVGDGDRVYVPRRGETAPPSASGTSGVGGTSGQQAGPVNLNTATPEQLDALPGVGPATAKAIVDYRTKHARFRTVDDLLSVPGIGPAKLANLKSLVRV